MMVDGSGLTGATGVAATRAERKRRKLLLGKALWYRHRVEGQGLEPAWAEVNPESVSTGASARVQASRLLAWYEQNHHPTILEAFDNAGLTVANAIHACKEALEANQYLYERETGEWREVPDHKVRLGSVDRMLKLVVLDKKVRKELTVGADQIPNQINTPPKHASVEEWDAWRTKREQDMMDRHRKAREEMAAIKAAQGIPDVTPLIGPPNREDH